MGSIIYCPKCGVGYDPSQRIGPDGSMEKCGLCGYGVEESQSEKETLAAFVLLVLGILWLAASGHVPMDRGGF